MAITPGATKRKELGKKGHAMPDGSFPIQDKQDLKDAISSIGLSKHPTEAKAHIIKRARALGATNLLPAKWLKTGVTNEAVQHSDDLDDFLEHFGVKGMHWGVINERDSSTGRVKPTAEEKAANRQAKREVGAQKFETHAAMFQTRINDINNSFDQRSFFSKRSAIKEIKDLEKFKAQALADAQAKREGKLTSTQKKVIIGAAVVGALIVGGVIHHNVQSGEFNRIAMKGKAFLHGGKGASPFKMNTGLADKTLHPDQVFESVVKHVNPNYGAPGTKVNCRRATFAYEMRRRGFDVSATKTINSEGQNVAGLYNALTPGKKEIGARTQSLLSRLAREEGAKGRHVATPLKDLSAAFGAGAKTKIEFPTGKAAALKTPQAIFDALGTQPNGARGELAVKWKVGGAHSLAYEIFDGKPVIFDTQAGKKYSNLRDSLDLLEVSEAAFTRLDNIPLNENYLMKWVKNAKS